MTVNSKSPVTGPLVADGVNNAWAFDFKVREVSHMHLKVSDADGSNEELITSGITIAAEYLNNDSGGYAVYSGVIAAGRIVYAVRAVPYVQQMRIGNQGQFWPQTHEDALDYLAMQIQQLVEMIVRAPMMPIGTDAETLADVISHINRIYNSADALDEVAAHMSDIENALVAATSASASAAAASASAGQASGYATSAEEAAEESATSAGNAAASAALAWARATAAAGSATAAANSADAAAANAAAIDVSNFYTKPEIDTALMAQNSYIADAARLTTGTVPNDRLPARLSPYTAWYPGELGHITDYNTATAYGCYFGRADAANAPPGTPWAIVTVASAAADMLRQDVYETGTGAHWFRSCNYAGAVVWGEWKRVYETAAEIQSLFPAYTSGEISIVTSSLTTLTHGLGAEPRNLRAYLVCKTTEFGYSVGAKLALAPAPFYLGGNAMGGVQISKANATTMTVSFGNQPPYIIPKAGGGGAYITAANWRLVVEASL